MYSMAFACSTMDFSMKPINDGVVDSPLNGRKCPIAMSSPSPLKQHLKSTLPQDPSLMNAMTLRKLYNKRMDGVAPHEV